MTPGHWLGEGEIAITGSEEKIHFYTKWYVLPIQDEMIRAVQVVEKEGVEDHIINSYCFSRIEENSFLVEVDNEMLGTAIAEGKIEGSVVRWEFSSDTPCPGFEQYQPSEGEEIHMLAGFTSEAYQTMVEGRIWHSGPLEE